LITSSLRLFATCIIQRAASLLTALAIALLASACSHAPEPALSDLPDSYLPDFFDYKVDPYIRLAVALQSMERSAALNKLHAMALTWRLHSAYTNRHGNRLTG
jgi:hypothetical protein